MASNDNASRKWRMPRLSYILLFIYTFSYFMTNGPGTLLVNKVKFIYGLPYLYVWLLVWGIVQIGCVAVACLKLWKPEEPEEGTR